MASREDFSCRPNARTATDIDTWLETSQRKSVLRFITCGSVDDGKSTLIGRLLYDSKMIFEDQLESLVADSKRIGTQGNNIDFALLVDGLGAEREQGITIDVAWRFFTTEKRKFIVADTPGHEQYTRNMITGASTADLAVILIDARKGVLTQTRRHSCLVHLVGIKNIVLAVNKMDLVDYDKEVFEKIVSDYRTCVQKIGIKTFTAIPLSGLVGDNITKPSTNMPWHDGPNLINHLETTEVENNADQAKAFTMPVQWVNRPNPDFRGFSGMIATGTIKSGDPVCIMPSGITSTIERIVTCPNGIGSGKPDIAVAGQSVTLTLADTIDCSRGDVIAETDTPPVSSDQFQSTLFWMHETKALPGRHYLMKIGTQTVNAAIQSIKYQLNVNTMEHVAAKTLSLNDIAVIELSTDQPVVFEPYDKNRDLGSYILIDKMTNATVAAGTIHFSLNRSTNIRWQSVDIDRNARARIKNQTPMVLWFTGLSGSGKSTIANAVEKRLHRMNRHTFLLDGDNIRHGLNRDLGFTDQARVENIRRIGEVSRLMTDAGLIVLTAFISPFRAERRMVRNMMPKGEFVEIYVNTPLEVAEKRDAKGLYKKARAGELKNFTGIDSPYEPPENPDIIVDTIKSSVKQAAQDIINRIFSWDD